MDELDMKLTTKEDYIDDDGEIVVVPTSVTQGKGLCQGDTARNLVLMIIMWICTSVNYQVINIYLKYVPGSEYLNITIAGFSEIAAHLSVGALFVKLGPKWTFFVGYTIAAAGGACLIFQEKFAANTVLVAAFVLLAKFGASQTMCTC
jgi:Na+/melibiose symporter-like transporter